jgi:hypothetical protein
VFFIISSRSFSSSVARRDLHPARAAVGVFLRGEAQASAEIQSALTGGIIATELTQSQEPLDINRFNSALLVQCSVNLPCCSVEISFPIDATVLNISRAGGSLEPKKRMRFKAL